MATKVMVIVRGMGEQRRNQTLLGLVRPLVALMRNRGDSTKSVSVVNGDLRFNVPAEVDVEYSGQLWRFMEYWWAEEIRPPATSKVSKWIIRRLLHHIVSLKNGFGRSFRDFHPIDRRPADERYDDPRIARIYRAVAGPILTLAFSALIPLAVVLAVLLFVLSLTRGIPGVPSIVSKIQSALQTIGVDYLGDIYLYFTDEVQGAQVCDGLQRTFQEISGNEPDCEIFVYAHSTGNVIAYEALAKLHEANDPAVGKVKAFISTGSILGMAWNPKIVKHERFLQPIPDGIHWYNLWTQYDVGCAGPLVKRFKSEPEGALPWNRRVNNMEDVALDHTGYLDNDEQVISLVLEEMGGLDTGNDFWRGSKDSDTSDWQHRSEQAWKDYDVRRGAVAWLAIWRLPVWFVFPVMFPLMI